VDENTNVDVFEETDKNYPRKFWFSKGTNESMKYHNHTHIKGIQNWINQSTQSKHGIMNLWIWK
jgi:hypothetical protein